MKSLMKKRSQWQGLRHGSEEATSRVLFKFLVPGDSFQIFPSFNYPCFVSVQLFRFFLSW